MVMDWVLKMAITSDSAGALLVWNLTSFQSVREIHFASNGMHCMTMDWGSMHLLGVCNNCVQVWNFGNDIQQVEIETLAALGSGTWASMTSNICKEALQAMNVSPATPHQ